MKPVILVTNDDGYDSPLLQVLAEVLAHHFDVRIVAPKREKSWIGKAISRKEKVEVEFCKDCAIPTWVVDGTPADCTNIALGHLLRDEDVRAIVSGINIGFNVSLPIILSSGTVGAALEGALQGYPAVSLSQLLAKEQFELLQKNRTRLDESLEQSIRESSIRSVAFIQNAIDQFDDGKASVQVHNINFPMGVTDQTSVEDCRVAMRKGASIFQPCENRENVYEFFYSEGENIVPEEKTDLNCLQQGHISYSLLDFSNLS